MSTRLRFTEGSADQITGTLKDLDGNVIPGNRVTAIRLTLYDIESGVLDGSPDLGIINDRNGFDVKSSGEATVDASGVFVLYLAADDNVIVNNRKAVERHRAELHFEWTNSDTSSGEMNVEVELEVENLGRV